MLCVQLEPHHQVDSNEYTKHAIILQKGLKDIPKLFPFVYIPVLWLTSVARIIYVEQITMVLKIFEPLSFDCKGI